jgi:hypothetical protein
MSTTVVQLQLLLVKFSIKYEAMSLPQSRLASGYPHCCYNVTLYFHFKKNIYSNPVNKIICSILTSVALTLLYKFSIYPTTIYFIHLLSTTTSNLKYNCQKKDSEVSSYLRHDVFQVPLSYNVIHSLRRCGVFSLSISYA